MVNYKDLENLYRQNLEIDIIKELAKKQQIDISKAMNIYYHSRLSEEIEKGLNGIDNMDYRYLVEDLMENEKGLFKNI